jgi:two-component system, OmpR family, sensor histidine kinase KdpD
MRGRLRVYLGAAPGVGKTFAMLAEGRRRAARGADVVVGVVEDYGRPQTAQQAADLEQLPRASGGGLDVAAIVRRNPAVVLVDELAAPAEGPAGRPRWEQVEDLLTAGVDVVTTVNVSELESLADEVESVTGLRPTVTVPDAVVRLAEQIELVDMAPEALRRRLAHGNVYPPERVDAALASYFEVGNLTALRELALLWLADRVDEGLTRYRAEHGIDEAWAARERVVVGVPADPRGEALVRRGARIAGRLSGGELIAVHVEVPTTADPGPEGRDVLDAHRALAESLGGSFHTVLGTDVATGLVEFARGANATQLVVGSSRAGRTARGRRAVVSAVLERAGDIDVHLVTTAKTPGGGRPGRGQQPAGRRRVLGTVLAVLGPFALVGLISLLGGRLDLSSELLLFLTLTVLVALVGGRWPAVASAVIGSVLLNFFFTPPVHTFTIAEPQNAFALLIFVGVAVAVAGVVDLAARRTEEAARSQAEAATLSALAGSALRGEDVPALLERMRSTFGMTAASVLERTDERTAWRVVAAVGQGPAPEPGACDAEVPLSPLLVVAMRGRPPAADQRRVLQAFAAYLGVVLERERLTAMAQEAQRLEEGNAIRTALLAAVSHDLRTPLAGIKAAVSSLRQDDVVWTEQDQAALLATIEESADRLTALVANLLDMSRLRTGAVEPQLRPVSLDEVVPRAVGAFAASGRLEVQVPEWLPLVSADLGLLERVVANLVENAARHGGDGPVVVSASALGDRVQLRVADRGRGVPEADKERIFGPFQRLGDAPMGAGVGLGLAVARGFTDATGGQLWAEDTPGGGLTMVLSLPVVGSSTRRPRRVPA